MNALKLTLYTLDPRYIFIDKDLQPIFTQLSLVTSTNDNETINKWDEFSISKSFKSP